jgi:hypothetical protein
MRRQKKGTYAALACAGSAAVLGTLGSVSCVGGTPTQPNPGAGEDLDASIPPLDGAPPPAEAAADATKPPADAGVDATDATEPPADAGVDATVTDAGMDAGFDSGLDGPVDVVVVDVADAAPPPCAPGSIAGFTPPGYVHAAAPQNPCASNDIQALSESCAGDASTYSLCSGFPTEALLWGESPACTSCLLTPEVTLPPPPDAGAPVDAGDDASADAAPDAGDDASADASDDAADAAEAAAPPPTYGAAIVSRVTLPNVAGCIELADQTSQGLACAMAIQAAWRCAEYSCNPTCPVSDDPSANAYLACTQEAAATTCKSYADVAAACIAAEQDAGAFAYTVCVQQQGVATSGTGPVATFENIASYFCAS